MKKLNLKKGTIVAHRGLHDKNIPENTIASFKEALKYQIPIECDVHILKDNTIVVFHDDSLIRLCNSDKKIKNCTYSEIKQYYIKESEEKIPTINEVLELINGQVPIIIELKYDVNKYRLEKHLAEILDQYKGDYYIKSFWPLTMMWWKKHRRKDKRGFLIKVKDQNKLKVWFLEHITSLLDLDFISYEQGFYDRPFIKKMQKKGVPIFYWTIKNNQQLEQADQYGDVFIIENIKYDSKTFDK